MYQRLSNIHVQRDALCEYILSDLATEYQTDLTLVGKCGRPIRAHKAVLCGTSPFIRSLCSDTHIGTQLLLLPDVDYETIYSLLRLVYTGQAELQGDEEIGKLEDLLHLLGFPNYVMKQLHRFTSVVNAPMLNCESDNQRDPEGDQSCRGSLKAFLPPGAEYKGPTGYTHQYTDKRRSSDLEIPKEFPSTSQLCTSSRNDRDSRRSLGRTTASSPKSQSAHRSKRLGITRSDTARERRRSSGKLAEHRQHSRSSSQKKSTHDTSSQKSRRSPKNVLHCNLCANISDSKMSLNEHLRRAHSITKIHVCSYCLWSFRNVSSLIFHQKSHKNVKCLFTCPTCSKNFDKEESMVEHTSIHTNAYLHKCLVCGKMLKQFRDLQSHMLYHMDSDGPT